MKKIYTLQLVMLNYCNLHCKYCYIMPDGHSLMSVETAKAAIREMIQNHPPEDWEYYVSFMGGEPTLAFHNIREICEWMWAEYPDITVHPSAPTNGTALTPEIRAWMRENRERFTLALSYDGDAVQDGNRSNSREKIDLPFFLENWPGQSLKLTIGEKDIETLAEDIIALKEKGFLISASFACGAPIWKEENVRAFGRQALLLADYQLSHPEEEMLDLINIDLRNILGYAEPMRPHCGIGDDYLTVDVDGEKYPCHLFCSLSVERERLEQGRQFRMGARDSYDVEGCKKCILNPVCPRCYGISFKRYGTPFAVEPNLCVLCKQQVRASCYYHIKRIAALAEMTQEDHEMLAAIKVLLPYIDAESHTPAIPRRWGKTWLDRAE